MRTFSLVSGVSASHSGAYISYTRRYPAWSFGATPRFIELIETGRLDISSMVSKTIKLEGVNDVLRPRFDKERLREDILAMHEALHESGARVATFTMPDMARVAPLAVVLRRRLDALNDIALEAAELYGTAVADLAADRMATDPALWHDDRLHANSEGHRRIALALADSLGLDAGDWRDPLPESPRTSIAGVLVRELAWTATHLAPWLWGRGLGRSAVEQGVCKRPELRPVE